MLKCIIIIAWYKHQITFKDQQSFWIWGEKKQLCQYLFPIQDFFTCFLWQLITSCLLGDWQTNQPKSIYTFFFGEDLKEKLCKISNVYSFSIYSAMSMVVTPCILLPRCNFSVLDGGASQEEEERSISNTCLWNFNIITWNKQNENAFFIPSFGPGLSCHKVQTLPALFFSPRLIVIFGAKTKYIYIVIFVAAGLKICQLLILPQLHPFSLSTFSPCPFSFPLSGQFPPIND